MAVGLRTREGCHRAQPRRRSPTTAVDSDRMAARVKREFLHAWGGYRNHAWGHDDLRPLTRSYRDWYGSPLLMTPVDALDTMILMGLNEEVSRTKELILSSLSFDRDIL